jgi:hypothetical protein
LIGHGGVKRQLAVDVLVMVPRGMEDVDKADAAFDQAAS